MNDFPDKDWKDYGHSTVKGALNLIPLSWRSTVSSI